MIIKVYIHILNDRLILMKMYFQQYFLTGIIRREVDLQVMYSLDHLLKYLGNT